MLGQDRPQLVRDGAERVLISARQKRIAVDRSSGFYGGSGGSSALGQ